MTSSTRRREKRGRGSAARRARRGLRSEESRPAFLVALAATVVLSVAGAAGAKVEVGYEDWGIGGAVKSGLWTQFYVELVSRREDFEGQLEVTVQAGQTARPVFIKPLTLIRETGTRHWVYFRSPAVARRERNGDYVWRVRDDRGRVVLQQSWRNPEILPSGDTCIAVMRGGDVAAAGLGALVDEESEIRTSVRFLSPPTAPDRAIGYESVDVLVWLNPDPSQQLAVPGQAEAIVDYVRRGGHLVLGAGSSWQALTQSFLADMLPATPTGAAVSLGMRELSRYSDEDQSGSTILLVQLSDVRGDVLLSSGGKPVVVRGNFGLGQVTLIGLDPTKAPFAELTYRKRLWSELLGLDTTRRSRTDVVGVTNASIPLMRALDDFPGFKPINFTFVAVFLVVYVILIGPVDYFVLKRMKKLHWTWVTFPTVAVISSLLAFALLSSGRVSGLFLNSASIVDASTDGDDAVGTTYATILSHKQQRYDVSLDDVTSGSLCPRRFETYVAQPGGGAFSRSTCAVWPVGERIAGMLIRIWDAQTIEATWTAQDLDLPEIELAYDGKRLTGTIANNTDERLDDVVVLLDGKAFAAGQVARGATRTLNQAGTHSVSAYARPYTQEGLRQYHHGGWGGSQVSSHRDQAARHARGLSLFSTAVGEDGHDGLFRRCLPSEESEYSCSVFDFPRRIALTSLQSRERAIVLYTVEKSFAKIALAGHSPNRWDVTLVRLRAPVTQRVTDGHLQEGDRS